MGEYDRIFINLLKKIDNNIIDTFYQEFHNSSEKDKK